jgi:hypothetical protein
MDADVERIADAYSSTLNFYGADTPLAKIMQQKRKFAARWPLRRYTVDPSSLAVQCAIRCAVTGIVSLDATSLERGAHSTGMARFNFELVYSPNAFFIIAESGEVIFSQNDSTTAPAPEGSATVSAAQLAASTTVGYTTGRQARTIWEDWVGKLVEGLYHDGVMFWAGNRSLKPQPTCAQTAQTADWQRGCTEARKFLTDVDQKRNTDKDYWWGWNSL